MIQRPRGTTWIKMCGMTRAEDLAAAIEAGVDAVGFVFAESPRRVTAATARLLIRDLPPQVMRVGVFVDENPAEVARIVAEAEIDRVQLHGFEEPTIRELVGTRVVKAFRALDEGVIEEIRPWGVRTFFLDTWTDAMAGGSALTGNWDLAKRARDLGRLVLAGGLTPENVAEAIRVVQPFGVDVSSGIEEAPGIKDPAKIRAFVDAVRAADHDLLAQADENS